jgi:glycosyltransferase involved in cell wall biosynthesis
MLSVLIPIKDERDNVGPLHEQLTSVLRPTGWDYEIVFVDDGSADDSFRLLDDLAARDDRV